MNAGIFIDINEELKKCFFDFDNKIESLKMDKAGHPQKSSKGTKRPRSYEPPVIWEVSQLLEDQKTINHPALESAIFVVHGMGKQGWVETAAVLRKGIRRCNRTN